MMLIHWGELQRQIRLKQMKFVLSVRGTGAGTQTLSGCQRVALTHRRYESPLIPHIAGSYQVSYKQFGVSLSNYRSDTVKHL